MKIKFLALCGLSMALCANCGTVFAQTGSQKIDAVYNDIKIVVDGKEVSTSTEPFIYNGTTYLPVRAIGEALGKDVSWDAQTNTVYIGSAETNASTQANEVIYDSNGLKVTYTGLSVNDFGEININLTIENNTDKDYTFQVRDFSLNGIMFEPIFSCDVVSGKKAVDGIYLPLWSLKDIGISQAEQIENAEFNLHIFNSKEWGEAIDTEKVNINF